MTPRERVITSMAQTLASSETPPIETYHLAEEYGRTIERVNNESLMSLFGGSLETDSLCGVEAPPSASTPEAFGRCLVSMAKSEGPSWFDTHHDFDMVLPPLRREG